MLINMFQFKEGEIRPVDDDILIAKLRPGQVCHISAHKIPDYHD